MGPDFAGKPARAVLLITPRLREADPAAAAAAAAESQDNEYRLQVLAMRLDKDGWPDGTLWASPSAFEAKTTKVIDHTTFSCGLSRGCVYVLFRLLNQDLG